VLPVVNHVQDHKTVHQIVVVVLVVLDIAIVLVFVEVIVIPIKILIYGAMVLIVYLVIEPATVVYRIVDNPVHLICNVSLRHVVVVIILGVLGLVDLLAGQIQIAS